MQNVQSVELGTYMSQLELDNILSNVASIFPMIEVFDINEANSKDIQYEFGRNWRPHQTNEVFIEAMYPLGYFEPIKYVMVVSSGPFSLYAVFMDDEMQYILKEPNERWWSDLGKRQLELGSIGVDMYENFGIDVANEHPLFEETSGQPAMTPSFKKQFETLVTSMKKKLGECDKANSWYYRSSGCSLAVLDADGTNGSVNITIAINGQTVLPDVQDAPEYFFQVFDAKDAHELVELLSSELGVYVNSGPKTIAK